MTSLPFRSGREGHQLGVCEMDLEATGVEENGGRESSHGEQLGDNRTGIRERMFSDLETPCESRATVPCAPQPAGSLFSKLLAAQRHTGH